MDNRDVASRLMIIANRLVAKSLDVNTVKSDLKRGAPSIDSSLLDAVSSWYVSGLSRKEAGDDFLPPGMNEEIIKGVFGGSFHDISVSPPKYNGDGFNLVVDFGSSDYRKATKVLERKLRSLGYVLSKLGDNEFKIYKPEQRIASRLVARPTVLDKWFEQLVPASGASETFEGELVRAMNRIIYRYYNDGDFCHTGYGVDTCGAAAVFLREMARKHSLSSLGQRVDELIESKDEPSYVRAMGRASMELARLLERKEGNFSPTNKHLDMWDWQPLANREFGSGRGGWQDTDDEE